LRGLRRRCPYCGGGSLFTSWLKVRRSCPRCGLLLDRGASDYFIGGYAVNFIVSEVLLAAFLTLGVAGSWPDVPWRFIQYGGIALMVVVPLVFFPYSRTIWLAIDLVFQPAEAEDFTESPPR
jgi:uncharacterized protein (DUF983 family)